MLTKLDGDARGGAALSVKEITGKPVKLVGVGEKLDDLEVFHPDRMASRILGMGDVLTLIEQAESKMDLDEAQHLADRFTSGEFSLEDFQRQIKQVKRMGSLKGMLKLLPGMGGGALDKVNLEDDQFVRVEAIINSMTPMERRKPDIINGSRRKRIARLESPPRRARHRGDTGQYNPRTEPSIIEIDDEKAKWLAEGVQPSRTVQRLLAIKGIGKYPRQSARVRRRGDAAC